MEGNNPQNKVNFVDPYNNVKVGSVTTFWEHCLDKGETFFNCFSRILPWFKQSCYFPFTHVLRFSSSYVGCLNQGKYQENACVNGMRKPYLRKKRLLPTWYDVTEKRLFLKCWLGTLPTTAWGLKQRPAAACRSGHPTRILKKIRSLFFFTFGILIGMSHFFSKHHISPQKQDAR